MECAPGYPEIQLCLLHKQGPLSFSMDLFKQGVVGRLVRELGRRGQQVRAPAHVIGVQRAREWPAMYKEYERVFL